MHGPFQVTENKKGKWPGSLCVLTHRLARILVFLVLSVQDGLAGRGWG